MAGFFSTTIFNTHLLIVIATDFRAAQNFSSTGQGSLVCKTFWADGEFFSGPNWLE
ncbi:hypothetical protein Aazo_2197 ['Nostoc azollae' 0708]|jgi:hypothetical protein|uniref:Uncharacterized protein n=1 Tax=Nostoc azollae (strain 0708) TaxID=551115 RepID=D7DXC4_NOSA0|nr:hypothetical protein Aazo_2197 ['Nostoc azollae' 0708]